jgi:hypothetical protein
MPDWINVKNAVPVENQEVLAWSPDWHNSFFVAVRHQYRNGDCRWNACPTGTRIMNEITHWMFLPESPE